MTDLTLNAAYFDRFSTRTGRLIRIDRDDNIGLLDTDDGIVRAPLDLLEPAVTEWIDVDESDRRFQVVANRATADYYIRDRVTGRLINGAWSDFQAVAEAATIRNMTCNRLNRLKIMRASILDMGAGRALDALNLMIASAETRLRLMGVPDEVPMVS